MKGEEEGIIEMDSLIENWEEVRGEECERKRKRKGKKREKKNFLHQKLMTN